jgi:hypothetical protein
VSNRFRLVSFSGALLLLTINAQVAHSSAISPNDIDTMTGSTVSSPITFEDFVAPSMAVPGYTSVQFLFTIMDPCNGCTGTTDMSEVYYGGASDFPVAMSAIGATPFATPCTFSVTIGSASLAYSAVTCTLSPSEANPNIAGSFLNDLKNGGLSIVVACIETSVSSYQGGSCTSDTNLNDKFFFSGSAGSTTNASMTLLPQASTPEPSTALFGSISIAVLTVLKLRRRSRLSDNSNGAQ